ncbi:hypothetical protein NY593_10085, partial [Enterobacter asburiae]|uniref:hypothetical protein n=1 Tax=Enterobacter asburiae TaxID=61645 RepID=UPI0022EFF71F
EPDFEILAPVTMSVVCFRYVPTGVSEIENLNKLNEKILHQLNATGKLFLTHTKLNGKDTLRMSIAGTLTTHSHV